MFTEDERWFGCVYDDVMKMFEGWFEAWRFWFEKWQIFIFSSFNGVW